jgi:hypothetical protein
MNGVGTMLEIERLPGRDNGVYEAFPFFADPENARASFAEAAQLAQ